MPQAVDIEIVETLRFPSENLLLEGRLAYPESLPPIGAVTIAGPHPMLGGNLENNVLRTLGIGLARLGIVNLAFNYRGVGDSEGKSLDVAQVMAEFWETSHIEEEADFAVDLQAAIETLDDAVGSTLPRALIGYSFGCSLLCTDEYTNIPKVLIAPTVGTHNYPSNQESAAPILVIAPDGDFAVQEERLLEWFDEILGPKLLLRGDWDGHFFRGHEERLTERVFQFLVKHWEGEECR